MLRAELEEMLAVSGQEFQTTIGTQSEVGPYEVWGSFSGSHGAAVTLDDLRYEFPNDGRAYIARTFRNPDGTPFMKISRFPEGAGKPGGEPQR